MCASVDVWMVHVCKCACVDVCMCIVFNHVCLCVYVCICVCIVLNGRLFNCIDVHRYTNVFSSNTSGKSSMYIYRCVHMFARMNVCMNVCMYVNICTGMQVYICQARVCMCMHVCMCVNLLD